MSLHFPGGLAFKLIIKSNVQTAMGFDWDPCSFSDEGFREAALDFLAHATSSHDADIGAITAKRKSLSVSEKSVRGAKTEKRSREEEDVTQKAEV